MKPYWQSADRKATLYHADCREVLPNLVNVDVVVTDPPYGVGIDYGTAPDTPAYVADLAREVTPLCLALARRVAITPGVQNVWLYPKPKWVLAWYYPSGHGYGAWGFNCWQPILVYGPDPFMERGLGCRPDVLSATGKSEPVRGHPCPKPLPIWRQVVDRVEPRLDVTVCDPFTGAGTTGMVCRATGRTFIGCEVDERFAELAAQRLEEASRHLFADVEARGPRQMEFGA